MIFGISDKDFFDKNKIKVIDGIAGAGKSSVIDKFFEDNAKKYGRYTSTNALKRDAQKRYPGTVCETVASGLFKTDGEKMIFYKEEKEIDFEDIVIDEVLQTSTKVIDFCKSNRGFKNIIITTDTKQMLAPECGDRLVKEFMSLKDDPNVIWVTLTESKRPVNQHTSDMYAYAYEHADDDRNLYGWVKNRVNVANYEDVKFTKDDIILTHTKDIEAFIYRQIDPRKAGFELIPKGSIARKGCKDTERVPVLPQRLAEEKGVKAYLQAKQICTPTRYQGSEVQPGQRLFFVVEKHSRVCAREIYTVLTRCKDIADLTMLTIDLPETEISEYFGRPVKRHGYLTIDHEMPELDKALAQGYMDAKDIESIVRKNKSDTISYDTSHIYYKGEMITTKENVDGLKCSKDAKYTPSSLMRKDEKMAYGYVSELYKAMEHHGVSQIVYPYIKRGHEEEMHLYELDLYSAYPTMLKCENMPVDGMVSYTKGQDGYIDYYLCVKENPIIPTDRMFTSEYPELIQYGEYLFSVPCEKGLKSGIFLYDQAHRSIESKAELKKFHWGYYQKKYLTPIYEYGSSEISYYELNENFIYEILMVNIVTILTKITHTLLTAVPGYPIVDAIHFNVENGDEIETLKEVMRQNFPEYDFRIKELEHVVSTDLEGNTLERYSFEDVASGNVILSRISYTLYKTYRDLLTEKERAKEIDRARKAQARAEGRVTDNRKNHHRKGA